MPFTHHNHHHHHTPHKRKLSLVEASSSSSDLVSVSSDTSGRFDDANESDVDVAMTPIPASTTAAAMVAAAAAKPLPAVPAIPAADEEKGETRSVHSAKRGRSNGWPLTNEIAYDENGMRIAKTPSATKAAAAKTEEDRRCARQSRFIEGSMNDRVSQKPPSIYFQNEHDLEEHDQQEGNKKQNNNVEKRSSGIFRFGKAIASAFHPFGAWNSSSSSSNSGHAGKSQKDVMKQRQARAEKAYAELKKSGFKGTSSAAANNKVDADIADQTWKAIQEKMDYKLPGESSGGDMLVVPKSVSKLKSFSELRKRTSTLSIPAMRARDVSSPMPLTRTAPVSEQQQHDESEKQIERRQSKKELNRQAKLMKRVSNLEDKLLRARRELREFSGGEQQQQHTVVPTICVDDCVDDVHSKLPTVLSERVLDQEQGMLLSDVEYETMQQPQQQQQQKAKWPPVDSLSRKRKPTGRQQEREKQSTYHNP